MACNAVFSASPALGDTGADNSAEQKNTPLEVIEVTATRLDTTLADTARSIAVLDRLDIESMQAQSVAQTLLLEPNITVAGGPRAANQAVNIRGLTGNKVLQTVDGARQSFESGHRPGYFLDPELLASVEAVRGPVSSLWGSGALGGVVAQRTLRAGDFLRDGREFGGFIKTGFNSNNQQHTSTAALLGRSDSRDWLVSGYSRDSDNIELGNGEELEGSASQSRGVLAKLHQNLSDSQSVELIYRGAQVDGAVPSNGEAPINEQSNFLLEREQQTHNLSVDYRYRPDSDWVDAQILAYGNQVSMDESRLSDGRSDSTRLNTIGINLSNRSRVGDTLLLYGIDSYRESFDARRSGNNRPTPPEGESDVWSAYSQAQVALSEQWRLDLGLRYDQFRTRADNLDSARSDDALSPSLALSFSPRDGAMLTLRHDRAFRAPGAEELYSSGTHFCMGPGFCNSFLPNPDLAPERAANTELLGRVEFAGPAGDDQLQLELSVFENRIDDFIEQIVSGPTFFGRPDPGSTSWINVDEARLRGAELSARYLRGDLSLRLGYGVTRGRDENSGEDLSNVPADTFNADLRYAFPAAGLVTGLRLTQAQDQRRLNVPELDPTTRFDGYSITDVYANWSPAALPQLRFDLNINNLTDEFYQRAWDQLPQPGREIILSAVYRF
jgi:hemoglobin/transferrin/lactoferrin receptor protein